MCVALTHLLLNKWTEIDQKILHFYILKEFRTKSLNNLYFSILDCPKLVYKFPLRSEFYGRTWSYYNERNKKREKKANNLEGQSYWSHEKGICLTWK